MIAAKAGVVDRDALVDGSADMDLHSMREVSRALFTDRGVNGIGKKESFTYNATCRGHGLCLAPELIAHALDVIHAIENNDGVAAQGALDSRKGHRTRLLF